VLAFLKLPGEPDVVTFLEPMVALPVVPLPPAPLPLPPASLAVDPTPWTAAQLAAPGQLLAIRDVQTTHHVPGDEVPAGPPLAIRDAPHVPAGEVHAGPPTIPSSGANKPETKQPSKQPKPEQFAHSWCPPAEAMEALKRAKAQKFTFDSSSDEDEPAIAMGAASDPIRVGSPQHKRTRLETPFMASEPVRVSPFMASEPVRVSSEPSFPEPRRLIEPTQDTRSQPNTMRAVDVDVSFLGGKDPSVKK